MDGRQRGRRWEEWEEAVEAWDPVAAARSVGFEIDANVLRYTPTWLMRLLYPVRRL